MKRILVVLILVLILASIPLLLISCGGTPFLEGKVWANKEVLTYNILKDKGEGNFDEIGEMVVTIENLLAGSHAITGQKNKVVLGKKATRIMKIATDVDGNVIMHSEALIDGFIAKASYKKVEYNSTSYEVSARYNGTNYYISRDGGKEKKIKIKKSFLDNEIIYEFLRCQELSRNFSTEVNVVDIVSGVKESLSLSVAGTGKYANGLEYTKLSGEIGNKPAVDTHVALIRKTAAPVGTAIEVHYAKKDSFVLNVGEGKSSYYPIVKIVEDDMIYELTKIETEFE